MSSTMSAKLLAMNLIHYIATEMNELPRLMLWNMGILFVLISSGCTTLNPPEITKRNDIGKYSFVHLPNTTKVSASSGSLYGVSSGGVYGFTESKEINLSNIIEGVLLKKGFISVDTIDKDIEGKTLIVRYGESGKREILGGLVGYTLEVAITIVTAETNEIVYSCVAEGIGATEADDLRNAIHRCLSKV